MTHTIPLLMLSLLCPLVVSACGGDDLPPGNGTIIHQRSVPIMPRLNPPRPNPPLNIQTPFVSVLRPQTMTLPANPNRPVSIQTPVVRQMPNLPLANLPLVNPARPHQAGAPITRAPNPALPNPGRPNPGMTLAPVHSNVLPGLNGVMPDDADDDD